MDTEHSTGTRSNSPRIATLTRWRSQGTGPKFVHIGRKAHYRRTNVDAWIGESSNQTASKE